MTQIQTQKFQDPKITAKGEARAYVALTHLETLWFNTGTRCNLSCHHCYIESTPSNDRLAYLTAAEVTGYLDEIKQGDWPTREIGFTGGEPLINPWIMDILEQTLARGHEVLLLTNAFRVIGRHKAALLDLNSRYGHQLLLRVSLDHYGAAKHEEERGPGTFAPTLKALSWLSEQGFNLSIAGRSRWGESAAEAKAGYQDLCATHKLNIDLDNPRNLVLFPEMDLEADVPEITTACWGILGKDPAQVMCATSRMVVKRKDAPKPVVLACTLIAYEPAFEMGHSLAQAKQPVSLNHPHCARFCVLGGASCSG